jgi:hypothetical protein
MLKSTLIKELNRRFDSDQKSIREGDLESYGKTCEENYLWLKKIIEKEGWLMEEKVGKGGENCAWLIVQHCDFDLPFQKKCLKLIESLPLTTERKGYIAYLTDRILVNEGKKQVYGTQFRNGEPCLIDDADKLDERRKGLGLDDFDDYYKYMNKKIKNY